MAPPYKLFAAAWVAVACSAAPVHSNQSLVFEDCPASLGAPGLQCASLVVPMDWDNPTSGQTVTLGVTKIPARDPSRRIGPLVYQPGGPGVLVSQQLAYIVTGQIKAEGEILDRFDFIGIDLRGSGLSDPITCSRELWNARQPVFATTPESFDTLVKHNQAIRQSCIDMTGSNLIDYMDTLSIVHDYEAVRQALGEKWTYLGQSYGTILGAQYAEVYAENLRGQILDGTFANWGEQTAQIIISGDATEGAMDFFLTWCAEQSASVCPAAHQNDKTLTEIWNDLMGKAAQSPIPAKECTSGKLDCPFDIAGPDDIRTAAHQLLYFQDRLFPILAQAFYEAAFKNDASIFLANFPSIPKGQNAYNSSEYFCENAIACQDFAHNSSATQMFWWNQTGTNDMPLLHAISTSAFFVRECVGWPQPKRNPPHEISIPDTLVPKVLMVAQKYDPATPAAWSVLVQGAIGEERAVLIQREKVGHTVYFDPSAYGGPTVAAMNHYLLTLETPPQRTVYNN